MATRTYDPQGIIAVFKGTIITGFADGTFIMAERNEAAFTHTVGASGESVRTRSRNKSGKVTFTLLSSAASNDALALIAQTDELTGAGKGPLLITDANGNTRIQAVQAWIEKVPNVEFGKEVTNREWVLQCEDLEIFAGGSIR